MKHCSFITLFSINLLAQLALVLSMGLATSLWANTPDKATRLKLEWLDLVPVTERNHLNYKAGMPLIRQDNQAASIGNIRAELNHKIIQIMGYMIPLESDGRVTTEFLLVPYYGASILSPPPLPNQIIYVAFLEGTPDKQLWDKVVLEGKLTAIQGMHDAIETGYLLTATRVLAYP